MERLTDKAWQNFDPWECCGQDKYCQKGCHDPGGCTKGCIVPQLYARLGAYEDTGMTPGEVKSMQEEHFSGLEMAKLHSALMELKKYQEADRAGLLVVLPCKVGDTLYEVTGRKTISEYRVKAIRVELFCVFIEWEIEKGFVWQSLTGITQNEIGKTVFLTREEAEKALEGGK